MRHTLRAFFSMVLVLSMLLCLCACGKDTSGLGTLEIGDSSDSSGTLEPLGGSDASDTEKTPEPENSEDPAPAPSSTEAPAEEKFLVEEYSCDCFDCYIPQGWYVNYNAVDAGGGTMRIYVFMQDPEDANNIIFYVSAMEPFFASLTDKKTFVSVGGSAYEWAPVLDELSATEVLRQWASIYTLMDATGFEDGVKYFKNYSIASIVSSKVLDDASAEKTTSQVIAEVTIPAASNTYGLLIADTLSKQYLSNIGVTYYISYNNQGFVLSADRFNSDADGLAYCLKSLDLSKFYEKYGSSVGFTAGENAGNDIEIILP